MGPFYLSLSASLRIDALLENDGKNEKVSLDWYGNVQKETTVDVFEPEGYVVHSIAASFE